MRNPRLLPALLAVLAFAAPVGAHAGGGNFRPPYDAYSENAFCSRGPLNATTSICAASGTADPSTGNVDFSIAIASPVGGTLPGRGFGGTFASFEASKVIRHASDTEIPIEVTLHVDSASVSTSGRIYGATGDTLPTALGYAALAVHVEHSSCSCITRESTYNYLIDLGSGPQVINDETIVLRLNLVNEGGENPIPAGTLKVQPVLVGEVNLGDLTVDTGEATLELHATVTSISIG